MNSRLQRLRSKMDEQKLSTLFLTGPEHLPNGLEHIRYLTGFSGSAGYSLVTPDSAFFFADPRYHLQAQNECRDFEVIQCPSKIFPCVIEKIKELGLSTIGLDKSNLTLAHYLELREGLPGIALQPTEGLIEALRLVKDAEEVEAIRRACHIVDRAFDQILGVLREGISEREVANELDAILRRLGADKAGFDSIIAFGPHSAFPHARPGDRTLEPGQFVKMDFGAQLNGYNSDLTRTVVFGPVTDRHREIYNIVREANERAIKTLRPGLKGKDVDAAARDYITEHGYGEQFGHGLGHGLGREVHDGGALNTLSETVIEPGQVWTIEPGVYIEGFGGVRVEDDVVVTETGCEVLTSAPKEMIVVD